MISFVIPIYNCGDKLEKNIIHLVDYLNKLHLNYELILSDDGSIDNSFEIIKNLAKTLTWVRFVHCKKNKGRGHALKLTSGLINGSKVIFMDADMPLTTDLTIISDLISRLDQFDVVIGSRFLPHAKLKRRVHRDLFSKLYRFLVRFLFPNLNILDCDVGIKAFKKKVFVKINKKTRCDRWSWDLEFLLLANNRGLLIKEIPLIWDEPSESSLNIFSASFEQLFYLFVFRMKYF